MIAVSIACCCAPVYICQVHSAEDISNTKEDRIRQKIDHKMDARCLLLLLLWCLDQPFSKYENMTGTAVYVE